MQGQRTQMQILRLLNGSMFTDQIYSNGARTRSLDRVMQKLLNGTICHADSATAGPCPMAPGVSR
jgi:hypothetical protein